MRRQIPVPTSHSSPPPPNDYKRQHNIDETRTASQKLLDRFLSRTLSGSSFNPQPILPTNSLSQELGFDVSNTQPRKKVKEVDSNISNEQILCKILDCIGNAEVSASKLNKAFVLLRKCISDQSFVIEEEDGKIWEKVGRTLLERDKNRVKGDQGIEIVQVKGDILRLLFLRLSQQKQSKLEKQDNIQIEKQNNGLQTNTIEQLSEDKGTVSVTIEKTVQADTYSSIETEQLYWTLKLFSSYYQLFTDDSFSFSKALTEFKELLFDYFEKLLSTTGASTVQNRQINESQSHKILNNSTLHIYPLNTPQNKQFQTPNESYSTLIHQLPLSLLTTLPYKKYIWMRSSLTTLLKQFNQSYRNTMQKHLLKEYLQKYNIFVNEVVKDDPTNFNRPQPLTNGAIVKTIEFVRAADQKDRWVDKQ